MQNQNTRAVAGGTLGGALGYLAILIATKLGVVFSADEAAAATAAVGVVFTWLARFLPRTEE